MFGKVSREVRADIQSNVRFTLDTNVLIDLAERGKIDLLKALAGHEKYLLTSINEYEILGLAKGNRISSSAEVLLIDLIKEIKAKNRYFKVNVRKIEKILKPFTKLLPRKIVSDVVITLPDSLISNIIVRYKYLSSKLEKGTITKLDMTKAVRDYEKDVDKLDKKLKIRFNELCSELDVDKSKIDKKKYFNHVEKFKAQLLAEIQRTTRKLRRFDKVILTLNSMTKKTFYNDVKFVAQTIAASAAGRSSDSDVIFLFEIHAAQKVS